MVTSRTIEDIKEEIIGLQLALARMEENKKKINNKIQKLSIELGKLQKLRKENVVLSSF